MKPITGIVCLLLLATFSCFAGAETDGASTQQVTCEMYSCGEEITSLTRELDELKQQLSTAKTQLQSVRAEAAELKSSHAAAQEAAQAQESEVKYMRDELAQAREQLPTVQAKLSATEEELQDLKQNADADTVLADENLSKALADIADRQAELEKTRQERDELSVKAQKAEQSRSSLEEKLAAAKAASSENADLHDELVKLLRENAQLKIALSSVRDAYLPPWSHPYYHKVAESQAVKKVLKYHREEIVTGKAYEKAKATARDLYSRAHTNTVPVLQKAWATMEPTARELHKPIQSAMDKLRTELSKEQYKPYVDKAAQAAAVARRYALQGYEQVQKAMNSEQARKVVDMAQMYVQKAIQMVQDVMNSEQAKQATAFLMSQKQKLERDLGNLYTHALGADIPGSGVDADMIGSLVQATVYLVPILMLLPLCYMCAGRREKPAMVATKGQGGASQPSTGPSSKGKRRQKKAV